MHLNKKKVFIAMAEAGLNQKKLAEKAGVSRPTVSSLIKGLNGSPISIKKIADALAIPMDEIIED